MATEAAAFKFSVEQFERMDEAGIFRPDERVELIDGEIYDMAAIGVGHAWCVDRLTGFLGDGLAGRAVLRVQNPAVLGPRTYVQPDLLVLRSPFERYRRAHPGPADVLLLIEVSDTSLAFDRSVKLSTYARMGIPEVWLVDLQGGRVEVHREPSDEMYASIARSDRGSAVTPAAFLDIVIEVDQILP